MKLLHTADWQIGMRAGHVAEIADRVRTARLEAIQRVMITAQARQVQVVVIAGDLFEDNQVHDGCVHQILKILGDAAPLPVVILPGNHDPLGYNSVYNRRAFQTPPANVTIVREARPIVLEQHGAVLLPNPIAQKHSATDPTTNLPAFHGTGLVRIGVTHGSLRIEGKYQHDDFPIALDAARRCGLDYLALGHWHSFYATDDRCSYCGTPEPTGFDEPDSGTVSLVQIDGPGSMPTIERVPVGLLRWLVWEEGLTESAEPVLHELRRRVQGLAEPEKTLIRLRVRGRIRLEAEQALDDFAAWARARLLFLDLDRSKLAPDISPGQLGDLAKAHPLLADVLADLAALEGLVVPPADGAAERLTVDEVQGLGGRPLDVSQLRSLVPSCAGDVGTIHEAMSIVAKVASEVWA